MKAKTARSRGATPKQQTLPWHQRSGTVLAQWRQRHQSGLRFAAMGVLLGCGGMGAWHSQHMVATWAQYFPIQRIQIMGDLQHVERTTLEAALRPYMEDSFFTVELNEVRQTAESITWIDFADVRKEWPNTLTVLLQERIPVANWGNKQFLSAKGEIFFAEHVQPNPNLPTFIGMEEQAVLIAQHYVQMQAVLKDAGLSIQTLEITDRISITVQLISGLTLTIDEKDSQEKLQRFIALYHLFTDEQRQQLLHVDLRYENGLAIKWKKGNGDTNAA